MGALDHIGKYLSVLLIIYAFIILWETTYWLIIVVLFASPILVIIGGIILEKIFEQLKDMAMLPLLPTENRLKLFLETYLKVYLYYFVISVVVSFLSQNSLISEIAGLELDPWQLCTFALALASLPRIVKFASVVERTRSMLLSIVVPLATISAPLLLLFPQDVVWPTSEMILWLSCAALFFAVLVDAVTYVAIRIEILRFPLLTEIASVTDLRATVLGTFGTIDFTLWVESWNELVAEGRMNDAAKIRDALSFACDLAKERNRGDILRNVLRSLGDLHGPKREEAKFRGILVKIVESVELVAHPEAGEFSEAKALLGSLARNHPAIFDRKELTRAMRKASKSTPWICDLIELD